MVLILKAFCRRDDNAVALCAAAAAGQSFNVAPPSQVCDRILRFHLANGFFTVLAVVPAKKSDHIAGHWSGWTDDWPTIEKLGIYHIPAIRRPVSDVEL